MIAKRDSLMPAAGALFAAAAAWPTVAEGIITLTMSPYERLVRGALCGSIATSAPLGHCLACWEGAAAFALAGASLFVLSQRRAAPVRSGAKR